MELCRAEHPQTGLSAACLSDGCTVILQGEKRLSTLRLFGEHFQEQNGWWSVEVRLKFSPSGRWLAVRVRGAFDPQEEDGWTEHYTPVYFRTLFVLDMDHLELAFSHVFEDESPGYENLAALAFYPEENLLAVGVPGGRFRLLSLPEGAVAGEFRSLIWVPDPINIQHRELIRFTDGETLVYLSKEKTANRLRQGTDGVWRPDGALSPKESREIMGEEFLLCYP